MRGPHITNVTVQHVTLVQWMAELEQEVSWCRCWHDRCCSPYCVGGLDVRKRWKGAKGEDGGFVKEQHVLNAALGPRSGIVTEAA